MRYWGAWLCKQLNTSCPVLPVGSRSVRKQNSFVLHNITYITSSFISVKTERSTTTICHAGQRLFTCSYAYTVTQDSPTRLSPKAARHRRRQGVANILSGGLSPRKHSPDGATAHIRLTGLLLIHRPRKDERLSWCNNK